MGEYTGVNPYHINLHFAMTFCDNVICFQFDRCADLYVLLNKQIFGSF